MGLLRKFFNQARRPEGFLGKAMLSGMSIAHAKVADWGISCLDGPNPSEIVDLGCGSGRNAAELLKKYPSARLTAIDYSSLSVAKTERSNRAMIVAGRCIVREGNVSDLNLGKGCFDLATAFETIYFWPGLRKCFAEVLSILKPGARFLIVNESDGRDAMTLKFEKIIDGMKTYTQEEIEAVLREAGFSEVKTAHHPKMPWLAVLAVKAAA